jgi:DMSO/TMAO reductase YedYZ molybdopterin-dependent catalytic subunit
MSDPQFNDNVIKGKIKRAQDKRGILSGGKPADHSMVEGSGPANRHGMPKLPVGQREVPNWPVLDLGIQPQIPLDQWTLEVKGDVEHPFKLTWKDFLALEQVKDTSDFHCVTTWSRMDNEWAGVRFRTLAEKAKLKPSAKFVYMTGYDGYSTNLKLDECLDDDVLLVHTWNGAPLPREHGGPVRMITPRKYAWKGSKWIKEIIFMSTEKLGFWELRGYSNTAEPWFNDRYS